MATDKRLAVALFVLLAVAFYVANHGAFRGYFQDDDLDNLSFTRELGLSQFFTPLVWPRVFENNFRPVGHLFYYVMARTAGLNYWAYIAFLQCVHLLNAALLCLLLRRLGLSFLASCAGTLFWVFHMAAFDVFWKPMYVFDLLCGSFCLLSLLAYMKDRWVLSLMAMWLGYRSKEVAIMMPVVIAAYEILLGGRRWKRLMPFFALSLTLGVQAIVQNHHREENDYSLHFTASSLWTCLRFYAGKVILVPYAGFLILLLFCLRDRRICFGVIGFCALLLPMLLLPGRLFSAYMYVPLIGLGVAAGSAAAKVDPPLIAAFFAIWLPWNYVNLRWDRRVVLANSDDRRAFSRGLAEFSKSNPDVRTFIGGKGPMNVYGTRAAIRLAYPPFTKILFTTQDDPDYPETLRHYPAAVLNWSPVRHDLGILVKRPETPDTSYIRMGSDTPIWQLEKGWYEPDGMYRWIQPEATARLRRPENVAHFELVVNVGPELLYRLKHSKVAVSLNGSVIGERDFTSASVQAVRWEVPAGPPGAAEIGFHVSPEYLSPRPLGIAIVSFGFIP